MRFPTSSRLLCRHNIVLKALDSQRILVHPCRPASSLSAIHDGLRQSHKSKPQGFSRSSLEAAKPRRSPQGSRRSRDQDWTPPTFKIKRGKKDVTDTGPEPQSRRSRFNDPTNSFGKKSLVYQMKHGVLRDKLAQLDSRGSGRKGSSSRRSSSDRLSPDDFMRDFKSTGARTPTKPGRASRSDPASSSHGRRSFERSDPASSSHGRRPFERESRPRTGARPGNFDSERVGRASSAYTRQPAEQESRPRFAARASSFSHERTERASSAHTRQPAEQKSRSRFAAHASSFAHERTERASSAHTRQPAEQESRPRFAARTSSFSHERTGRADVSPPEARHEAFGKASSFGSSHNSSINRPSQSGEPRNQDEQDNRKQQEDRRFNDGPVRVHHTTAASQFLYGRTAVEAALKSSRRQLYKLYLYNGNDRRNTSQDETLAKLAGQKTVDVTRVSNDGLRMMDKMSDGRPHNGCILEASPLPQPPLKALGPLSEDPERPGFHLEMAHQSSEEAKVNGTSDLVSYELPPGRKPFVLLLDGILDPGNLGAILRTAAFLGVNGIAITKGSSATVTPIALKASAGAAEVSTLFSVSSATEFLARSKENGWLVYAAVPSTKRSRGNSHLTVDRVETYDPLSSQPTILVMGSEGEGLSKPVRRQADHEVSIPSPAGRLSNIVDSLNVSVATGILCAAFLKKQSSGLIEIEETSSRSEDDESSLW
ncbi:RNA methyltransferase [Xylaria palmicola]|nr:RNA methyltransferase [Xylaria palmicola]